MLPEWLPWLLQVNDSQFPSGAYAHSMGLEELVQHGLVKNADDLEIFLHRQIIPSLLNFELPFLLQAHAAASAANHGTLRRLDEDLDAWKLAGELRQASRQLGSRRLSLVQKLNKDDFVSTYVQRAAPCHHLIACALETRHLPVSAACCAFGLQTLSGYAISAMKLIRLGQERCQLIIRGSMTLLAGRLDGMISASETRIGWFNPLLEIASMRHARANERLFIS
ncbi:urease accessory protein UreF [Brevifollis gellanilyticus]|uniref:Urease accessory protein UreF n=1 Tax=Brevifollis gellanilyticus TaxID=748831 RepID=A0A512M2X8_9BACT|nr:urease accessory UreF family protein [Brevifollis gellanilyticus]GEP41090.1 urease accessory protein UreF [Brevifollis gellanilyticus]